MTSQNARKSTTVFAKAVLRHTCFSTLYIDQRLRGWYRSNPIVIALDSENRIETVFFADDQAIMAEKKDDLHRAEHNLEIEAKKYNMKMFTTKTKIPVSKEKDPTRSKIAIGGKIIKTGQYL